MDNLRLAPTPVVLRARSNENPQCNNPLGRRRVGASRGYTPLSKCEVLVFGFQISATFCLTGTKRSRGSAVILAHASELNDSMI